MSDNAHLKLDEYKARLPEFKQTLETIRRSL
jgi:hypothetical protein